MDEKIDVTREMRLAGSDCLEEFIGGPGGLTNSAGYVAEAVYRAMEQARPSFIDHQSETGSSIQMMEDGGITIVFCPSLMPES